MRHIIALGYDIFDNIQHLDNLLDGFPEMLKACEEQLDNTITQLENAKYEVEKPFPHEDKLKTKFARLDELNILLNMHKRENEIADSEPENDEKTPNERISSLER